MPRSNPRPTLKLPARPAASTNPRPARDADGERAPARKPIRGGSKTKPSVARKANVITAKTERFAPRPNEAVERGRQRFGDAPVPAPARDVPPALARKTGEGKKNSPAGASSAASTVRSERTSPAAKVYPKRGIARSTGARALPPPRTTGDAFDPAAPAETSSTPPAPMHSRPAAPAAARQAAPEPAAPAPRRPLNEPPRLSKRISELHACSRREADEWIENGWVSVDGVVVTTLGVRVHPSGRIEIRDEASRHQTESVTILLNRPAELDPEASERRDEATAELIGANNRWAEDERRLNFKATHLRGLAQAGKLEPEASGMLVFTQEGSVARRINGDDTRLEKEYMVRVEGELSPEGMQLLNHGLALDDIKLKRAQVSWQNEQQLRFVLHETRKQQISRMCELVGLRVTSIKRIRIGSVSLGKLPVGQWRYLRENERF